VELPCKMDGAVPGDGVPGGRICGTEKLNLQTEAHHSDRGCETDDPMRRLPCRPAWRAANHFNIRDFSVDHLDCEFRRTKAFTIASQADLPGEAASGWRGVDVRTAVFLAGGHHRYPLLEAFFH